MPLDAARKGDPMGIRIILGLAFYAFITAFVMFGDWPWPVLLAPPAGLAVGYGPGWIARRLSERPPTETK